MNNRRTFKLIALLASVIVLALVAFFSPNHAPDVIKGSALLAVGWVLQSFLPKPGYRLGISLTNLDDEIFSDAVLEAFTKKLLPLTRFSTNFSAAPGVRGANVIVPLVAALTATTHNGNYAICGGTMTVVTVPLDRHKVVHVGQTDLDAHNSSRAELERFGRQQGASLAEEVLKDILSLVTTSNFARASSVASTALAVAELRLTRLLLNQSNVPMEPRSLILDCVPYDALLGITNFVQAHMFKDNNVLSEGKVMRALGFDLEEVNNLFTAVSVMGFAAHAQAIAIAMRYLAPQDGHTYHRAQALTDPTTGLTIGLRDFFDNATGTRYRILECNYGRAVGITPAGRVIGKTDS